MSKKSKYIVSTGICMFKNCKGLNCFYLQVMQCVPRLLKCDSLNIVPLVYMSSKKHYDPKFRKWRRLKFDIVSIKQTRLCNK